MFRSMNKMYYRGVSGVVLVCDIHNRESFENLESWLAEFINKQDRSVSEADFGFILIGNKTDLLSPPAVVSEKDMKQWCSE